MKFEKHTGEYYLTNGYFEIRDENVEKTAREMGLKYHVRKEVHGTHRPGLIHVHPHMRINSGHFSVSQS